MDENDQVNFPLGKMNSIMNRWTRVADVVCLVGVIFMTSGCLAFAHSGRLDAFLVEELHRYGARAPLISPSAELSGTWKYRRDQFGIVIITSSIPFEKVDAFFREAYGAPEVNELRDGPQYVIPARRAGVAVWYRQRTNGVWVTINRPFQY